MDTVTRVQILDEPEGICVGVQKIYNKEVFNPEESAVSWHREREREVSQHSRYVTPFWALVCGAVDSGLRSWPFISLPWKEHEEATISGDISQRSLNDDRVYTLPVPDWLWRCISTGCKSNTKTFRTFVNIKRVYISDKQLLLSPSSNGIILNLHLDTICSYFHSLNTFRPLYPILSWVLCPLYPLYAKAFWIK